MSFRCGLNDVFVIRPPPCVGTLMDGLFCDENDIIHGISAPCMPLQNKILWNGFAEALIFF
ncbi:hypothetical protein SDJN02_24034, partial [Cucurbita argyrosperma subsp. argyrosperma]